MNKTELGAAVAAILGVKKENGVESVEAVISAITNALQSGDSVKLVGFGTFDVRDRAARVGRNPQDGSEVQIEAKQVPAWKPSDKYKESFK